MWFTNDIKYFRLKEEFGWRSTNTGNKADYQFKKSLIWLQVLNFDVIQLLTHLSGEQ